MSSTTGSPSMDSPAAFSPSEVRDIMDQRHRKSTSSTGGGRAWSAEEVRSPCFSFSCIEAKTTQEAYLIETRTHKMPYKHIAAHLKKTELACRLHYHQLSIGNKRHRRAASTSSFASIEHSPTSPIRKVTEDIHQRQLPPFNPSSNLDRYGHPFDRTSGSPQSHIPILPKPVRSSQHAYQSTKTLRLITEDVGNFEERHIDMQRLNRIYNAHRIHFWSMISQSYGGNVSPSILEDAWRKYHSNSKPDFPPTPCGSPESYKPASSILSTPFTSVTEPSKGFTPINPPQRTDSLPHVTERGTFAISSLLTEDKEVRSPPHERKL